MCLPTVRTSFTTENYYERFEPRSHFKRLSLIVQVNVVLNRTVVVDNNARQSRPQSLSFLGHVVLNSLEIKPSGSRDKNGQHSFGLPRRMNGMHRRQFDHVRLDLLSLPI